MISAVAVVIPIHDEAELLPSCLAALERAIAASPVAVKTVLVLDACRDASLAICTRWAATQRGVELLELEVRNVGLARAAGIARALASSAAEAAQVWIATTDADTRVPRRWLREQVRLANEGIDAFAGTIRVADWSEHVAGLRERFVEFYERGNSDAHTHVHGANLGVRASAYLAVGGFPALATGEDHALWRALAAHPRLATRRLPVITSSRTHARAPAGFSGFLLAMTES